VTPQTHYQVLQVSRDAEPEVIEKAYRALSLKYHPDRAGSSDRDRATRRMQRINEAYRVLSDAGSRRRYDRTLPPDGVHAGGWERFMEDGLVGLFQDWLRSQP
jgi:molecular chaperone DnaJ